MARISAAAVAFVVCSLVSVSTGHAVPAPVGAWLFDEGEGEVARDSSGSGNDGKLEASADWADGLRGSAVVFGPALGHVLFNADGDPDNAFILHQDTDATLALWVRPDEGGHGSYFWSRGDGADHGRFNVHNGAGAEFNFDYREDADAQPDPPHGGAPAATLQRGEWVHVGITRIGNEYEIWRSAVSQGPWTDRDPNLPTAQAWMLGGPRGCCPINTTVDELAVWNVALSGAEMEKVMDGVAGLTRPVGPAGRLTLAWGAIKKR